MHLMPFWVRCAFDSVSPGWWVSMVRVVDRGGDEQVVHVRVELSYWGRLVRYWPVDYRVRRSCLNILRITLCTLYCINSSGNIPRGW